MNAQDIFYVLASIYLSLGILLTLILIFTVVFVVRKLNSIHRDVSMRIEKEINDIKEQPSLLARYLGHVVAKAVKNKFMDDE